MDPISEDPERSAPALGGEGPRPSATFSSGEGKASVLVVAASALALFLDKASLLQLDSLERKLVIGGVFVVVAALTVSRGLSKNGTGL